MDGIEHAKASPARIDSQANVVRNDEEVEGPRAAEGPRQVSPLLVEPIDVRNGDAVHERNCQWHCRMQQTLVDFRSDIEWSRQSAVSWRRIECLRVCSCFKTKQTQWWIGRVDRVSRARLGRSNEHGDEY